MADRRYIAVAVRRLVQERAHDCCEYCIAPANFCPDSFQFDHITAYSLGGTSDEGNIAYSCGNCNLYKQNRTHHIDTVTGSQVRLFHPRQDLWTAHFCWSDDELFILGITPTGRATVELLHLNRIGNVNLRSLLKLVGLHPPPFSNPLSAQDE
jgi:HNH endonuclease